MSKMVINKRLRQRVYEKMKALKKLRPISKEGIKSIRERFDSIYTYNSNAIEGNTLTEGETILLLERGITIGGKSLREHLEATNHKEAISNLYKMINQNQPITEETLFKLHSIVMKDLLPDEQVGAYRTRSVIISGAKKMPPVAQLIPREMDDLFYIMNNNPEKIPPVEFCARIHYLFEATHPFSDGNGRTGRLLLNLMLMKNKFAPMIIKTENRNLYLDALDDASQNKFDPLTNLILKYEEQALDFFLEGLNPNHTPPQYMRLAELAKITPYSPEYLSLLIRQGKIAAQKKGKVWFATKESVQQYIDTLGEWRTRGDGKRFRIKTKK